MCAFPAAGRAQGQQEARPELDPDRLAESMLMPLFLGMVRSDLIPIIASLRVESGWDPRLSQLLGQLKLEAFGTFSGPYGARATQGFGAPGIEVDLSLVTSTKVCARYIVAKRHLPRRPGSLVDQYINAWKEVYTQRFVEAARDGTTPPPASGFDLHEYLASQLWVYFLEDYAERAYQDVLTWVVLHEVGHHYLGHLQPCRERPKPCREHPTDAQSRDMELAADIWALKRMQALGYPTNYLMAFVMLQAEMEEAGFGPGPERGSHPSWGFRARVLERSRAYDRQPSSGLVSLSVRFETTNEETNGRYLTHAFLLFPANPKAFGGNFGAILDKDQFQFLAVEGYEPDTKGLRLHGRAGHGRPVTIVISDPDAEVVELVVIEPAEPKARLRAVGLGIRDPYTHYLASSGKGGPSLRDTLNFQPRKVMEQALGALKLDTTTRKHALQIISRRQTELSDLWLAFQKSNMTMKDFVAAWSALEERATADLKRALGPDRYPRYQASVLGNELVATGMATALNIKGVGEFPAHNLLEMIRGRRIDIVRNGSVGQGHRFRTQGMEMDSIYEDDFIERYGMHNHGRLSKTLNAGFDNRYRVIEDKGDALVHDEASGLTWQQAGSDHSMEWHQVPGWVANLTRKRPGGHGDWRLPTLEEVLTLNEPEYSENQLYIQPVFSQRQSCLWTADSRGEYRLALNLKLGLLHLRKPDEQCFVRAVRSTH